MVLGKQACSLPIFVCFLILLIVMNPDVFSASAIELLDHNVSTNKTAYPHVDLQSLVLDWDDDELPPEVLGSIDLIMYVVYAPSLSLQSKTSRTVWQTLRITRHRSLHLFAHWTDSFSRHNRQWVIDRLVLFSHTSNVILQKGLCGPCCLILVFKWYW